MKQQHTERIDVTRGHRGFAGDLLRRGVFERQTTARELCELGHRRVGIVIEHARDTEIEELYLTVHSDQHVRRLEVAVQYELVVRMFDRERDIADEVEPLIERWCVFIDVIKQRHAVD